MIMVRWLKSAPAILIYDINIQPTFNQHTHTHTHALPANAQPRLLQRLSRSGGARGGRKDGGGGIFAECHACFVFSENAKALIY